MNTLFEHQPSAGIASSNPQNAAVPAETVGSNRQRNTNRPERSRNRPTTTHLSSWDLEWQLSPHRLKVDNIPERLVSVIKNVFDNHPDETRLFAVLSELYNNALDHGILKLDSALKQDAHGYAAYYAERDRRLNDLTNGCITIRLAQSGSAQDKQLVVEVTDSGSGFDYSAPATVEQPHHPAGRGLALLRKFCTCLDYCHPGNTVRAVIDCR
jgi:signal transduction histidine kinase